MIHSYQGSVSLNLLGGLPSTPPDPEDLQYYDITVDDVSFGFVKATAYFSFMSIIYISLYMHENNPVCTLYLFYN